jgi:hypothetical protein
VPPDASSTFVKGSSFQPAALFHRSRQAITAWNHKIGSPFPKDPVVDAEKTQFFRWLF